MRKETSIWDYDESVWGKKRKWKYTMAYIHLLFLIKEWNAKENKRNAEKLEVRNNGIPKNNVKIKERRKVKMKEFLPIFLRNKMKQSM